MHNRECLGSILRCISLVRILVVWFIFLNSLGLSDTIWRHKSGSTLAQVMACCLTAPSHCLNQCWLFISEIQWYSSECNFTRDVSTINHWNAFENYICKISFKFPRDQWVNIQPEPLMNFIHLVRFLEIVLMQLVKTNPRAEAGKRFWGSFQYKDCLPRYQDHHYKCKTAMVVTPPR